MNEDPADLNNLRDIVVPEEIIWWPPGPAWYVVIAIIFILLFYYIIVGLKNWRSNAYRRDALKQLAQADSATGIAEILRRTALAFTAREEIADLSGDRWVEWLVIHHSQPPSDGVRNLLSGGLYKANDSLALIDEFQRYAKEWITHHKK